MISNKEASVLRNVESLSVGTPAAFDATSQDRKAIRGLDLP